MKRLFQRTVGKLTRSTRSGAIKIAACVLGANAGAAIGQHLNQVVGSAVSDRVGGEIFRSVTTLAAMGGDTNSILSQIATDLGGSLLMLALGLLWTLCPRQVAERLNPTLVRRRHVEQAELYAGGVDTNFGKHDVGRHSGFCSGAERPVG